MSENRWNTLQQHYEDLKTKIAKAHLRLTSYSIRLIALAKFIEVLFFSFFKSIFVN